MRAIAIARAALAIGLLPHVAAAQSGPKLAPNRAARPPAPIATTRAPAVLTTDGARALLLAGLVDAGAAPGPGGDVGSEEIVRFEPVASGPTGGMYLSLATKIARPPAQVIAQLADAATYQRAVPAFIRADVRARAPALGTLPAHLIDWELEIPLWNLTGRLWLHPRPDGAILDLVDGDLTPGHIELTVIPGARDERESVLVISGGVNLKNANWITRRLAARDPEAEPAMAVTALYVLLRGLRLEIERPASNTNPTPDPRWPKAPPRAPAAAAIDGDRWGQRLPLVAATSGMAHVISRRDGRLDRIEIAVPVALPAATAAARVPEPQRWRALPGWKRIVARAGGNDVEALWQVEAGLPFIDFDATWSILRTQPFRAEARAGDWSGAVMGIDVRAAAPGSTQLIFTENPRIDQVGFIPRRLIAAEPLLEHGLALGLAFVDAHALARALGPPSAPKDAGNRPP